jgi:hypothetical protein
MARSFAARESFISRVGAVAPKRREKKEVMLSSRERGALV